jgi:hypothetical protein
VPLEPSTAGEDFGRQLAGTPESWARSDFEKAVCALKDSGKREFNEQESFSLGVADGLKEKGTPIRCPGY